jgi:ATP synthase protein I
LTKPEPGKIKRPAIANIAMLDMIAAVSITGMVYFLWPQELIPLLTGLCIFLIPNLIFIWQAFRYMGAKQARKVVQSFYIGETFKFTMTICLFIYVFLMVPTNNYFVIFAAYIGLWLVHQVAAFCMVDSTGTAFKI